MNRTKSDSNIILSNIELKLNIIFVDQTDSNMLGLGNWAQKSHFWPKTNWHRTLFEPWQAWFKAQKLAWFLRKAHAKCKHNNDQKASFNTFCLIQIIAHCPFTVIKYYLLTSKIPIVNLSKMLRKLNFLLQTIFRYFITS